MTPPARSPAAASTGSFSTSSRNRLTTHDLARFPTDSLFDRLGRAVCAAGCLPRKELYEAWEVARRVRRVCRGGRVVDLGGGHGLLAQVLLLLDDSSPTALVVDPRLPPSHAVLHHALVAAWPRLERRVTYLDSSMDDVVLTADDLVVSAHPCGALTDRVIERAVEARAPVAVLPCCHDLDVSEDGGLSGWLEPTLAVDVVRAVTLARHGYRIRTQTIPSAITPKNRLLVAVPM